MTTLGVGRMFAHDAEGRAITRERQCLCGRAYRQSLLSARFLALCEARGEHVVALVQSQCPGGFVPVHCPACERRALARPSDPIYRDMGRRTREPAGVVA